MRQKAHPRSTGLTKSAKSLEEARYGQGESDHDCRGGDRYEQRLVAFLRPVQVMKASPDRRKAETTPPPSRSGLRRVRPVSFAISFDERPRATSRRQFFCPSDKLSQGSLKGHSVRPLRKPV